MSQRQAQNGSASSRVKGLKPSASDDPARKTRDDIANALRKQKREGQLAKRQRPAESNPRDSGEASKAHHAAMSLPPLSPDEVDQTLPDLQRYHAFLSSTDPAAVLDGARWFRRLLTIDIHRLANVVRVVIPTRAHLSLARLLSSAYDPVVQFEALWALTSIASPHGQQNLDMRAADGSEILSPTQALIDSELFQRLYSSDPSQILGAIKLFRRLLSIERNPPISGVLCSRVERRFAEVLTFDDYPDIQFEACWSLTNIASGNAFQTAAVIDTGCVTTFVRLLKSPSEEVADQAAWALGNIAGDNTKTRDYVLRQNCVPNLIHLLDSDNVKISILRNAAWTLTNLCRGKPRPPFDLIVPVIPCLQSLLYADDKMVLLDTLWALSYLSDGDNKWIEAVVEAGVTRRLVDLLLRPEPPFQQVAVRTLGNICTGDDLQTQTCINVGILPCLLTLLVSSKTTVRKEACWALSNITAGTRSQIGYVIDAGLIMPLAQIVATGEPVVVREAAWALSNATVGGSDEHIRDMVELGIIPPLVKLLSPSIEESLVCVVLEGLSNVLLVGDKDKLSGSSINPYVTILEEYDGTVAIEKLQYHKSQDISQLAVRMCDLYFRGSNTDDDDDDEASGLMPPVSGRRPAFLPSSTPSYFPNGYS